MYSYHGMYSYKLLKITLHILYWLKRNIWASTRTRRAKVIMLPSAVYKMKSSMGQHSCLLSCIQVKFLKRFFKVEIILKATSYLFCFSDRQISLKLGVPNHDYGIAINIPIIFLLLLMLSTSKLLHTQMLTFEFSPTDVYLLIAMFNHCINKHHS